MFIPTIIELYLVGNTSILFTQCNGLHTIFFRNCISRVQIMKNDNINLAFSALVSFVDSATQMMRIPTIHFYLASIGAPERWRITFLRTSGFFTVLLITSPLLMLLESFSAIRGLIVVLCVVKVVSNIIYSVPLMYLNVFLGELVNTSIRVLLISVVSFQSFRDKSNEPKSNVQSILRVFAPLGVLTGASCSVVFNNLEIDFNGFKIDALNSSGAFSALLWIFVSFFAIFIDFSERNLSFSGGNYSPLKASETVDEPNFVEKAHAILKSLVKLFSQRSFLVLYFNYFVVASMHILLVLMLIILPRDFFHWDLFYSGLVAIAYGSVDAISNCLVICLAKFGKFSNPFVIFYGLIATFLGIICCIVMHTGSFQGNLSLICFYLVIIFVGSGFTFANEGVRLVAINSGIANQRSFGFSHLVNIFLIPRIISSSISGVTLDYLVGYCTVLGILLLFGLVGFLIYWDEFKYH